MEIPTLRDYPTPDPKINPWAKELTPKNTAQNARSSNLYRYAGKEKDSESGLYYYGARYYAPWLCRFISVDKLAEKYAQLSPYNYADNSPVTHFDIDGNQSTKSKGSKQGSNSSGGTGGSTQSSNATTQKTQVHGASGPPVRHAKDFHGQQGSDYGFGSMGASETTDWKQTVNGKEYQIYQCPECMGPSGKRGHLMWQGKTWVSSTTTQRNSTFTPGTTHTAIQNQQNVGSVANAFTPGTSNPTPALANAVNTAQNSLNQPVPAPTSESGRVVQTDQTTMKPAMSEDNQERTSVTQTTTTQQIQNTSYETVVTISFDTTQGNNANTRAVFQQRFASLLNQLGNPKNVVYNPAGNGYNMNNNQMGGGYNQVNIGTGIRVTTTTGTRTTTTTTTTTARRTF